MCRHSCLVCDLTYEYGTLQSAQRKLFDVANSLGLSDSVLKVIDRRQKLDKRIVYGGMVGPLAEPSGCCLPSSAKQELLHLLVLQVLVVLLVLLLLWWLR